MCISKLKYAIVVAMSARKICRHPCTWRVYDSWERELGNRLETAFYQRPTEGSWDYIIKISVELFTLDFIHERSELGFRWLFAMLYNIQLSSWDDSLRTVTVSQKLIDRNRKGFQAENQEKVHSTRWKKNKGKARVLERIQQWRKATINRVRDRLKYTDIEVT